MIEWDKDYRVSRWLPSAERLFGWQAEEVIGKAVGDWKFVCPEDLNAVYEVGERQRQGLTGAVSREIETIQSRVRSFTTSGTTQFCITTREN